MGSGCLSRKSDTVYSKKDSKVESKTGSKADMSGEQGSGDEGSGQQESGDQGSGQQGSGQQGPGDQGSGDQGSGQQRSGDQEPGDQGSGDQGSGDQGSRKQGALKNGLDNNEETRVAGIDQFAPWRELFKNCDHQRMHELLQEKNQELRRLTDALNADMRAHEGDIGASRTIQQLERNYKRFFETKVEWLAPPVEKLDQRVHLCKVFQETFEFTKCDLHNKLKSVLQAIFIPDPQSHNEQPPTKYNEREMKHAYFRLFLAVGLTQQDLENKLKDSHCPREIIERVWQFLTTEPPFMTTSQGRYSSGRIAAMRKEERKGMCASCKQTMKDIDKHIDGRQHELEGPLCIHNGHVVINNNPKKNEVKENFKIFYQCGVVFLLCECQRRLENFLMINEDKDIEFNPSTMEEMGRAYTRLLLAHGLKRKPCVEELDEHLKKKNITAELLLQKDALELAWNLLTSIPPLIATTKPDHFQSEHLEGKNDTPSQEDIVVLRPVLLSSCMKDVAVEGIWLLVKNV